MVRVLFLRSSRQLCANVLARTLNVRKLRHYIVGVGHMCHGHAMLGWMFGHVRTLYCWFWENWQIQITPILLSNFCVNIEKGGKLAWSSSSNEAAESARKMNPMFHVRTRGRDGGYLLWNTLHSLLSVPNCDGVNVCFSAMADKIEALYTHIVVAAKPTV